MGFSKWYSKNKAPQKECGLTLSDIIRGLQYCVNSSVEIAEQHYATTINKFMDQQSKLLTKRIYIDDTHAMDIPLLSMTDHSALAFEEMTVRMSVNMKDAEMKEACSGFQGDNHNFKVSRSAFNVELKNPGIQPVGSTMDLEIKFKAADPPEALCRLIDQVNNSIQLRHCDTPNPKK